MPLKVRKPSLRVKLAVASAGSGRDGLMVSVGVEVEGRCCCHSSLVGCWEEGGLFYMISLLTPDDG